MLLHPAAEPISRFLLGHERLAEFHSPEQVADFFHGLGIRGVRGDGNACPQQRFLQGCVGEIGHVTGAAYAATYWPYAVLSGFGTVSLNDTARVVCTNTPAVETFVRWFDLGAYPNLAE